MVNENLGIKFGIVENPELQQAHPSKYTLYHKELPEPLNYNGEINGLLEWILKNGYPEVITLTEEEFVKAEREKISLIAVADVKNSQIHEHFKTLTK